VAGCNITLQLEENSSHSKIASLFIPKLVIFKHLIASLLSDNVYKSVFSFLKGRIELFALIYKCLNINVQVKRSQSTYSLLSLV
jgi:hypothetical protein